MRLSAAAMVKASWAATGYGFAAGHADAPHFGDPDLSRSRADAARSAAGTAAVLIGGLDHDEQFDRMGIRATGSVPIGADLTSPFDSVAACQAAASPYVALPRCLPAN